MKNYWTGAITALALMLVLFPVGALNAQLVTGEVIDLPGFAFKYSVSTAASPDTVWLLWTDVENWQAFDTLLQYSRLEEGEEFREGAVGYLKARGAPRTRFEIQNVNERQSFSVRLLLPLWQVIEQQRYFESTGSGETVFTDEIRFRGGLSAIVWLLLNRIYKRETIAVVENLKAIAEAR